MGCEARWLSERYLRRWGAGGWGELAETVGVTASVPVGLGALGHSADEWAASGGWDEWVDDDEGEGCAECGDKEGVEEAGEGGDEAEYDEDCSCFDDVGGCADCEEGLSVGGRDGGGLFEAGGVSGPETPAVLSKIGAYVRSHQKDPMMVAIKIKPGGKAKLLGTLKKAGFDVDELETMSTGQRFIVFMSKKELAQLASGVKPKKGAGPAKKGARGPKGAAAAGKGEDLPKALSGIGAYLRPHMKDKSKATIKIDAKKEDELLGVLASMGFNVDKLDTMKTGQRFMVFLDRKEMEAKFAGKMDKLWAAAGGVVVDKLEPTANTYLVLPSSKGLGSWTLPKGKVDAGETAKKAAVREVEEESGLKASILPGGYLGKHKGDYSQTEYWLMLRKGGSPAKAGWETSEVKELPLGAALALLKKARDIQVMTKAIKVLAKLSGSTEAEVLAAAGAAAQPEKVVVVGMPKLQKELKAVGGYLRAHETDANMIVVKAPKANAKALEDLLKSLGLDVDKLKSALGAKNLMFFVPKEQLEKAIGVPIKIADLKGSGAASGVGLGATAAAGALAKLAKKHDLPALGDTEPSHVVDIGGTKVRFYGFTDEMMDKTVPEFQKAYTKLKQKGFEKAWGGRIYVYPFANGGTLGRYEYKWDMTELWKGMDTETIVHELGHRWWYKGMTKANRFKFIDWIEAQARYGVEPLKPVSDYPYRAHGRMKKKGGKWVPARRKSPDSWEAFAEAFAYYVMDKEMDHQQRLTFKLVTKGGPVEAREDDTLKDRIRSLLKSWEEPLAERRFDGTGPRGRGPRTGRGLGRCAAEDGRGYGGGEIGDDEWDEEADSLMRERNHDGTGPRGRGPRTGRGRGLCPDEEDALTAAVRKIVTTEEEEPFSFEIELGDDGAFEWERH